MQTFQFFPEQIMYVLTVFNNGTGTLLLVKQEAQLLLGDRATRKHTKDSWNGRGNDNLGWMTFKCTSSSSKVAPIES